MAKPKNVNLNNYKAIFSSGKQQLQNIVRKISLSRKKERSTDNRGTFDPMSTRYKIPIGRLRLPK
ncbi:MAG: hypothetical protein ACFFAJ_17615 [Candidatus Hodarchaeota archaeon]